MSNRAHRRTKASLYRAVILSTAALALTAFSFHGVLDNFARTQVVETTNESVSIYVVSRGINAVVSVLQTSEINVPLVASMQVGEMLDPINDAVERLSSIVVWAVGSLFLQRILLEVASSSAFKWILFSIGLVMVATLLLMEWGRFRVVCREIFAVSNAKLERCRDWTVRVFVLAAIFRFVVPLFLAVSFLVSQLFLEAGIMENKEKLSLLGTQVSNIASFPSPDGHDLDGQKNREQSRLKDLDESMALAIREAERLDEAIGKLKGDAGLRRFLPERLGGISLGEDFASAKEQREEVDREIVRIEVQIRDGRKNLECIARQIAGGTCESWFDKVSRAGKGGMFHIREMFGKVNDMVTSVTMLLIAVSMKNLLFPILFLMVAVKCSLPIAHHASRLLCGFERDSEKLKGMMKQLKTTPRQLEQQ